MMQLFLLTTVLRQNVPPGRHSDSVPSFHNIPFLTDDRLEEAFTQASNEWFSIANNAMSTDFNTFQDFLIKINNTLEINNIHTQRAVTVSIITNSVTLNLSSKYRSLKLQQIFPFILIPTLLTNKHMHHIANIVIIFVRQIRAHTSQSLYSIVFFSVVNYLY